MGLTVDAKKKQPVGKLAVTVSCQFACTVKAKGKAKAKPESKRDGGKARAFKLRGKPKTVALAPGEAAKLKMKLKGADRRELEKLIEDGWKAKAKAKVKGTGPAGDDQAKVSVKLKA